MTPIKYIGKRPTYKDGCYGSYIEFKQGETVNVEDDALAKKLLKHPDVYELGEVADTPTVGKQDEKKECGDTPESLQEARDLINSMTKDALVSYAQTHFGQKVDKRQSVDAMRARVIGLTDQFGIE